MKKQKSDANTKCLIEHTFSLIAELLLLNASSTDSSGLINGKIDIEKFSYIYALKTDNETYKQFADEHKGDLIKVITARSPPSAFRYDYLEFSQNKRIFVVKDKPLER